MNDLSEFPLLAKETGPAWLPPAASEARKLVYWGQIALLVLSVLWLIYGLASVISLHLFVGVYALIAAAISFVLVLMLNNTVFEPLDQGRFKEAHDNLLIWAILGLIFGLIGGIILLFGYIRLQEVFQPQYQQYPTQYYQQPQQYPQAPQPRMNQQPQPQQPQPQQKAPSSTPQNVQPQDQRAPVAPSAQAPTTQVQQPNPAQTNKLMLGANPHHNRQRPRYLPLRSHARQRCKNVRTVVSNIQHS